MSDPSIPTSLKYFKDKLKIPFSYLVTLNGDKRFTKDGITILPAAQFFTGLV
ncbi:MAG: hypothetical protein HRT90_04905 [Candidatus Margulisbacteria bacterium]|nr:hypothetical protein [Candidatus Margulisiibacteriota bacterium]